MAPTPSSSKTLAPAPAPQPAPGPQQSNQLHTCIDFTNKWVINLSKNPLTLEQLSLLQKGPNFAITPKYPTIEAYISAVEQASPKLPTHEAEEFRSDVSTSYLNNNNNPTTTTNVTSTPQCRALTQLKQGKSRVVFTADKGWPWSSWTKRITPTKP